MDLKLAKLVEEIEESVTMAFDQKAKAMKAQYPETIILAAGEPDFAPPQAVIEATAKAALDGKTKYMPVKGNSRLLEAIAKLVEQTRGLKYNPKTQVMATNGAKEAIFLALLATINPGDKVIIVKPYWTSYPEMVKLCGGIPLFIEYYEFTNLKGAFDDPKVKAIILNSPDNPSGRMLEKESLEVLAMNLRVKKHRGIWVISDEIYSPLVYGGACHISIAQLPDMAERTLLVDGASKAFAMTGYRLGYALGPKELIAAMAKFKSQISSCACSISQEAALAALRESVADVEIMRRAYEKRLNNIILPFAEKMELNYFKPQGAFYFFFQIPGENANCLQFCEDLLEKEKLGLVPGMAFGYPGWVRLSFAAADKELIEGLKRLERFLNK